MEINILELFNLLLRKIWIIVLSAVVCASLAFAYSYFYLTPMYTSTTTLYVNNTEAKYNDTISYSDLSAAEYLVDTYVEIIQSKSVVKRVCEDVNSKTRNEYKVSDISGMVSAEALNDTVIVKISVQCEDPEDAQIIASSFVTNAQDRIEEVINSSGVRIVDEANLPTSTSYPNNKLYLILGFLAGAIISAAVIIIIDVLDTRIETEQDFAESFGDIPVVGIIPKIDEV